MMRADDVLAQIDNALYDYDIGPDAMRHSPRAAIPTSGRELLIQRLVDRHGLRPLTARRAVLAVEQGHTAEHADLVHAEARAAAAEMVQQIRIAFRPTVEAFTAAMKQMAQAFERLHATVAPAPAPGRRHDRPAWASPYGPAPRRRL